MAKWMIANKKADFDGIAAKYGISNITARLIANRLINSRETEKEDCSLEKVDLRKHGRSDEGIWHQLFVGNHTETVPEEV